MAKATSEATGQNWRDGPENTQVDGGTVASKATAQTEDTPYWSGIGHLIEGAKFARMAATDLSESCALGGVFATCAHVGVLHLAESS